MTKLKPLIHPNWALALNRMTDGYSIEITAKDVATLERHAAAIAPGMPIAITYLPGEELAGRVNAARTVRRLGFEPMPHFSARRIGSVEAFETYLAAVVAEAGVTRCFVVAGDAPVSQGPFGDSMSLIRTGAFERAGIKAIGIGGHPEGHPVMGEAARWAVLEAKCEAIAGRGMAALIVTQFAFDADTVLAWLRELRARGIHDPVRLGIPGPASIKTLLRFAARCGVGASASVMSNYGLSLSRLIGSTGPDRLIDELEARLGPEHGMIRLHFYPFGGVGQTIQWINDYIARN